MEDLLCKEKILENLKSPQDFDISVFSNIDSTNVYLKSLAKENEKEGKVIIADSQTKGHGRFDRKFHSPENSGIYMSVLLKPDIKAEQSVMLTVATAVAVCDAIVALTKQNPKIKWVNDILINGKKICGILTEGSINAKTQKLDWAVVGIGINVYTPKDNFDYTIRDIADSLLKTKKQDFRNIFCAEILNRLQNFCDNLENKEFLQKYKEYSAVLDQKIKVIKPDITVPATAILIDDQCRLKVRYEDGREELLNSGEISIIMEKVRRNKSVSPQNR